MAVLRTACVCALALLAPAIGAQQRPLDWFATVPGVPGCATQPGQNGKIEIENLHQLWFRAESSAMNPAQEATREFITSKEMDCSSRLLWDRFRQGTVFPEVVLEGYETSGTFRIFQRIELRNVTIESLETSDRLPDGLPVERVRWMFNWVEVTSYCYDPQDGSPCGEYTFQHDFSGPPA